MPITLEGLRARHAGEAPTPPAPTPETKSNTTTPTFRKGSQPRQADTRPSTIGQRNYIRDLLAAREGNADAERIREQCRNWMNQPGGMTFAAASGTIDALKAIDPNVRTFDQASHTFRPRPNQFADDCFECKKRVEPGEGLLVGRSDDDKEWLVRHRDGECAPAAIDFPFPLGSYALMDGDTVKFYVANTDGLFAQASDELWPITKPESIEAVVAAIAADPLAASKLYGQKLGKCGRCGRTLTSKWADVGIGPVCVTKEGWA